MHKLPIRKQIKLDMLFFKKLLPLLIFEEMFRPKQNQKVVEEKAWLGDYNLTPESDPDNKLFLKKFREIKSLWSHSEHCLRTNQCNHCGKEFTQFEYYPLEFRDIPVQWAFVEIVEHYYAEHNIKPSPEFRDYVMNYERPTTEQFMEYLINGHMNTIFKVKKKSNYPLDIREAMDKVEWENWYQNLVNLEVLKIMSGPAGIRYSD